MSMFYSHLLLSKKGPFGTIWVAAHCHKKLKKDQITHTNISASVDKILKDGVPTVTCRILAFLLLGVVRIYSKKVEYLLHDCRDVLTEILHFATSKHTSTNLGGMCTPQPTHKRRAISHVENICAPYSAITLPQKFELDSFDLELLEDARGDHVKSCNEITLHDSWEDGRSGCHSLYKDQFGKDTGLIEDFSEAFFPPRESSNPNSMEKLRDHRFSLEERFDPMILGEGEQESDFRRSFDQEHETAGDHVKASFLEMIVEERAERSGLNSSFYDLQHTKGEKEVILKMNSVGTEKLQVTPEHRAVPLTLDETPESKMQNVLGTTSNAGATTPESMAVRTPAPKERPRITRKRRTIIDDRVVVPNSVLKGWIDDCSDLVYKRRKVPSTTKHIWKAHRVVNLPQSFLDPLIPCVPVDFKLLTPNKKLETPEAVKPMVIPAKSDGLKPIEIIETAAIADGCGSPGTQGFPEEETIAPSTPVTHSTSVRFNEICPTSKSNEVEPVSSSEGIEREFSPTEDQDLDEVLMNEESDPYQGDSQEIDKWSTRTRIVARHLHKNFVLRRKIGKKETGEALRFSQVLKGKSKKESARLFYELLALKTGGYVDVKQEKAYGDILLLACSTLKKACEAVGS